MHIRIKRICVPTDFSEAGDSAVRYGAALAEHHGSELHLLHVLQDFGAIVSHPDFTAHGDAARAYFNQLEEEATAKKLGEPVEQPLIKTDHQTRECSKTTATHHAAEEDAKENIRSFLRSMENDADDKFERLLVAPWWERLNVTRAVRYGHPIEEICRYARKHAIALLVLGTHGRSGLKQLLVGSVAERVVRIAPCPVLTVRESENDFLVDD